MMVRHSREFREEKMGRRIQRRLRPDLEPFEPRVLLSAITDILAANSLAATSSGSEIGESISVSLGDRTLNQGPLLNADGSINNQALAPSGTPKPGVLKREQFTARYVGPYSVVPGQDHNPGHPDLDPGCRDREHDAPLRHPDATRHPETTRASRSAVSPRSSTATSIPIQSSGSTSSAPQSER